MSARRSVCGIAERDGRYLLVQRGTAGTQAGKWEFPGGKVEDGEDPAGALEREWLEELALAVQARELVFVGGFSHGGHDYRLEAWTVRLQSDAWRLVEHTAAAWVAAAELEGYDLSDSDRQVARFLASR